MRTQQLAAARLKTLHQQASTRLEAMQAEILRQKQQRVMMQRQLREQQKEKRREHADHVKVLPAFVATISVGTMNDSWGRTPGLELKRAAGVGKNAGDGQAATHGGARLARAEQAEAYAAGTCCRGRETEPMCGLEQITDVQVGAATSGA
jgi:hypothetical protein